MRSHGCTWRVAALALAICLAGCSDSSPLRFSGILRSDDVADTKPNPGSGLAMRGPPSTARGNFDDKVQQATFAPMREAPPQSPVEAFEQPLRVLHQRAAQRYATMDSYIFRLRRREVVNGRKQPEEIVRVEVRREPFSVHLVWLDESCKGREVIYVQGKYDNKMQVMLEAGHTFAFLGRRKCFALDDPMVRSESRHPMTNTGFGSLIDGFGKLLTSIEKGEPRAGTARYLGQVKRPEFEAKVEAVHQVLPPGGEPGLPKGGQRWWFFDATNGLPVLIVTNDPSGEVEYYCHDHIQAPARLDDSDFNPDGWKK